MPLDTFQADGVLQRPEPVFGNRLMRYFRTSPTFRRPILVAAEAAPGQHAIRGQLDFQVCNGASGRCYIIRKHPFEVPLMVTTQGLPPAPDPQASDEAETAVGPEVPDATLPESPLVSVHPSPEDAPTVEVPQPSIEESEPIGPVTIVLGATDLDEAFQVEVPESTNNWWVPGMLLAVGFALLFRFRSARRASTLEKPRDVERDNVEHQAADQDEAHVIGYEHGPLAGFSPPE